MVIFHSYVKLPEGMITYWPIEIVPQPISRSASDTWSDHRPLEFQAQIRGKQLLHQALSLRKSNCL